MRGKKSTDVCISSHPLTVPTYILKEYVLLANDHQKKKNNNNKNEREMDKKKKSS